MSKKPIEIAIAKEELSRINGVLQYPLLLIGGLAVQQYSVARKSKDIDLHCDHETARDLIQRLYPTHEWKVIDANNDEYRPSYRITHLTEDRGEIILGPKISERSPYQFIDWQAISRDSQPFLYKGRALEKIRVPTPSALAYTKLISFIGRRSQNHDKGLQDLQDLADLSNHEGFSLIVFLSIANAAGALTLIKQSTMFEDEEEIRIFRKSSLSRIAELFGDAIGKKPGQEKAGAEAPVPHEMTPIEDEIVRIALRHQGKEPPPRTEARELLIVVDVQNDFFEGGALAVHDPASLMSPLNELIRQAERAGVHIVFTRDWHPEDHYSFPKWGKHCIKTSNGAEFHPDLYRPVDSLIVDIGDANDMDGYSPFSDPRMQALITRQDVQTVYVVGIALEFCVLATCRDALWYGRTVVAVEPYIRSAYRTSAQRENVWQLLSSLGVVRALNVPLKARSTVTGTAVTPNPGPQADG